MINMLHLSPDQPARPSSSRLQLLSKLDLAERWCARLEWRELQARLSLLATLGCTRSPCRTTPVTWSYHTLSHLVNNLPA